MKNYEQAVPAGDTVGAVWQPTRDELFGIVVSARSRLERAWGRDTVFQGATPYPDAPVSMGQCGVSSLWLARRLSNLGVAARFAEGQIVLGGVVKEGHCWVETVDKDGRPVYVADVTSDQYETQFGKRAYVGRPHENGAAARYIAWSRFHPFAVPHQKLLGRHAILSERIRRQWA